MTPRQFRLFTVKRKLMPQSFTVARIIRMSRSCHSHVTSFCDRMPQLALVVAVSVLAFTFLFDTAAHGQVPGASSPMQSTAQPTTGDGSSPATTGSSDGGNTGSDRSGSTSPSPLTGPIALSSDQIIHILQQNPDLVVELKSQVADRLQQQGTQIDANDISDQMLYSEIATNANLRANITTFLRARGYVSQDDLQAMATRRW